MRAPTVKYEINLNTIVLIVGFGITTTAWGVTWGSFTSDVKAMDNKFTSEITRLDKNQALADERARATETEVRKIENLGYRMTVQEQASVAQTRSVDELKTLVTTIASDMRFVKEATQRNDAQRAGRQP